MEKQEITTDEAKSPEIVIKLMILERFQWVTDALEKYHELKIYKASTFRSECTFRSRLISLFYLVSDAFQKDKGEDTTKELHHQIMENDINKPIMAYNEIKSYIYKKGLSKWDTRVGIPPGDKHRLERINKHRGI